MMPRFVPTLQLSFPRKRESRATVPSPALDLRFRGGDGESASACAESGTQISLDQHAKALIARWVHLRSSARHLCSSVVNNLLWAQTGRARQRGFTLMEIIISLAILAVALTAVMQAFSGGLRATTASERQASAILLARSLLDRVGRDVALVPGDQSGVTEEGYRWLVRIQPAQVIDAERAAESPVLPYDVQVQVAGTGRPVTLTTLRLAAVVFAERSEP